MSRIILLDAGPLGLLCHPNAGAVHQACTDWLISLIAGGVRIAIPEIADYEVRRELLRLGSERRIRMLDGLTETLSYEPLTTGVMRLAADNWARARAMGRPTADDKALDCDMILVAQAEVLGSAGFETLIATTNVRHLAVFSPAAEWMSIS